MKRLWIPVCISFVLIALLLVGCNVSVRVEAPVVRESEATAAPEAEKTASSLILSTTTSTEDSGLLGFILPDFTAQTGIAVKVVAVGTGAALKNGEEGNCDVVLVHAPASEKEFVAQGFGLERFEVMYNDFVLLGPAEDPAGIAQHKTDTAAALKAIADYGKTPFVSRADDSGTHKKELTLWEVAGVEPKGDWYVEAGQGMGAVLTMSEEMNAYTMSDRATFLSRADELSLVILVEGDQELMNQYGVIAVNPEISENINSVGAQQFVDWILSPETQTLIGQFGVAEYGQPLFFANAQPRD